MAEQLGTAELVLELNDQDLRKGLEELRKEIAKLDAKPLELTVKGSNTATTALRDISTQADTAATRVRILNQLLNDFPSGTYSGLSAQIKKLSQETLTLQLNSDKYLQTLTRIKELEGLRQFKAGRQAAVAGEAAYGPDGALGQLDQSQLPQLPLTLEGQAQNIRELQQRLRNLNFESADYAETLRVLQRAQREYSDAVSGTSSTYRELEQAEERAIRRAEKLQGIQQYYADKNPRAGGTRDESGAIRARGAGSAADERAYNASLRPSQELLEQDLQRVQALRQVTQRLQEQAALLDQIRSKQGNQTYSSFGEASASNFRASPQDPVEKSIRRNREKVDKRYEKFEEDLASVRRTRIEAQKASAASWVAIAKADAEEAAAARKSAQARIDGLRRRTGDAIGSGLIGGAFPALFGQGVGASVGGGVGGVVGGAIGGQFGFGLSLVGTAIGQRFDDISRALENPIKNLDALRTAGLLSSRALQNNVEALVEQGRAAEAAAAIQFDLVRLGDTVDTEQLREAGDNINRAFTEASIVVGNFVAGPLADFLRRLRGGGGSPSAPQGGPTLAERRRLTDNSNAFINGGTALAGLGLGLAFTGVGLPIALGLLGFGSLAVGVGAATRPKPPDPSGTQANMDREFEAIAKLRETRQLREDLIRLSFQLTAADAQGNKTLVDAIKLTSSYKQERLALLALTPEERSGPQGQAIRERARAERQAVREQAKAAAESSARDLKNAKELVGLYGTQRQIKEEELKIAEAKRLADQAEDAKNRNKFTDPANRKVLEDRALAAANAYNKVRIEGEQRIGELQRQNFAQQIASLNRLADLQDQINVQNTRAQGQLTGAGIGALESFNQFKAARRLEQNAQAELRVRPGDIGLQNAAREAAKQTELAAAKARADLIEAAEAAEKSVKSISESLQDAVLAQQALVGGNQGLNAFLPGQAATNRQAQVNAELQAATRAAKQEFINSLGPNADPNVVGAVNRREFSGTLAEQNAQMIQFIESIRQEIRGAQGIDDLNQQLVKAQNDLVTINGKLYEINVELRNSMSTLAEKNWTVNVNVPGGSASGDVVGAVNSRS